MTIPGALFSWWREQRSVLVANLKSNTSIYGLTLRASCWNLAAFLVSATALSTKPTDWSMLPSILSIMPPYWRQSEDKTQTEDKWPKVRSIRIWTVTQIALQVFWELWHSIYVLGSIVFLFVIIWCHSRYYTSTENALHIYILIPLQKNYIKACKYSTGQIRNLLAEWLQVYYWNVSSKKQAAATTHSLRQLQVGKHCR